LKQGQASLRRLNELTTNPLERSTSNRGIIPDNIRGRLSFNNVFFSYNDKTDVIKDIDLEIESGRIMALVGPSGSGKSTLLRCISRLTDATGGKIFIEGQDLLQLNNKDLIVVKFPSDLLIFSPPTLTIPL